MKILFQGDSVTDAGRTAYKYENLGRGYPNFVAGALLSRHPEKGFKIINRGIGGNRVVDLYQRWKVDCLNLEPDVISILIGVNDTWHESAFKNGVEPARAEKVYRALVEWTREALPAAKLVICEPFLFTLSQAGSEYKIGENWSGQDAWRAEIDERRAFTRRIADDFGCLFVPFQSALDEALSAAPAPYWLGDGVHPTTAGHALLADAWIKAASPLLGL